MLRLIVVARRLSNCNSKANTITTKQSSMHESVEKELWTPLNFQYTFFLRMNIRQSMQINIPQSVCKNQHERRDLIIIRCNGDSVVVRFNSSWRVSDKSFNYGTFFCQLTWNTVELIIIYHHNIFVKRITSHLFSWRCVVNFWPLQIKQRICCYAYADRCYSSVTFYTTGETKSLRLNATWKKSENFLSIPLLSNSCSEFQVYQKGRIDCDNDYKKELFLSHLIILSVLNLQEYYRIKWNVKQYLCKLISKACVNACCK